MTYAGLDIGTSGCKVAVYDLEGNVIFQASRKYNAQCEDGIYEINPMEVLTHIKSVLKEVGNNCPRHIDAMAIASLGESIVILDENDYCLINSMVVGDQRGIEEVHQLISVMGKEQIINVTGLPPSEMYGLPKYMWINNHTNNIKKAKSIMFYEDYIGYMLTGQNFYPLPE